VARQNLPANNGRVGVYGISYPGFYTSMAGIDNHPAIKAISPQAPVSDWFHGDDMHHNGALFLAQNYNFFTEFGQPRPVPTSTNDYLKPFKWGTQDGYKFYLEMGGVGNSGDIYQKQLGTRIKFWDELTAHPNYDQFWAERNILPKLKNIKAAVMTVGGWYDNEDLFGASNLPAHRTPESGHLQRTRRRPLVSRRLGAFRRRMARHGLLRAEDRRVLPRTL
jgi:predicted acyl esterase